MNHELVLLSPYRYPAQYAMTLSDEDMASWLNGFTALWHPALLWQAKGPPRCETTYDHEQPKAGQIYALPETPAAYFSDDWEQRVRQAGSLVFKATPDRHATLANLQAALKADAAPPLGWKQGLDSAAENVGPFFGLAWGHQLLAALSEAMEREGAVDAAGFWDEVQQAVAALGGLSYTPQSPPPLTEGDAAAPHAPGDWRHFLRLAAERLLAARELLYPVTIHLLDTAFLDEASMAHGWPAALEFGVPANFIAATATLEKLAEHAPNRFAQLKTAVQNEAAEILGGSYLEREDPLLPIDSQLWNLRHGLDRAKELLGADIRVFARKRFGYHPHLPLFLHSSGLSKALFLTFDETSGLPSYSNLVISWPSPNGKQIEAFVRQPRFADSVESFFNLGHYWFKTTREDHAATLFLLHRDKPTAVWHRDLMELAKLAPVLGRWTTFSRYLSEVQPGEYPSLMTADDFHFDFLSERIAEQKPDPVSVFPRHLRTRRRIDACWTYAALHRALSGVRDTLGVESELSAIENQAESTLAAPAELDALERRAAAALAERLQSRAEANKPGWMVLNPCGFARRAAIDVEGGAHPLPIGGVVKACQLDAGRLRAVIEIPALGFAWLPREGPPGTPPMTSKIRLAEPQSHTIRNDHFVVEVDPASGGLKAVRDHRSGANRLGQMLVFNPGSRMVASQIKITSSGPALAEIVSEGTLIGEQEQVLADFKQRLRLWVGRPLLEMRIELTPRQPPAGYGWHAYYGARFAWRDERCILVRGLGGMGFITNHPRPQTPDYLDIRTPAAPKTMLSKVMPGAQTTTILTGGLPFHQKQGGRMVDVILVPEGEKATTFELAIAMDREVPMQTAWGYASPLAVVPTVKGPPHIGASGWLFHIDAPNLLLTRMTPGKSERQEARGDGRGVEDAITARFLECANYSGLAEFRCVRDPARAVVLDARGQFLLEANRSGDIVHLEVTPNDLAQVQVEFSLPGAEPGT